MIEILCTLAGVVAGVAIVASIMHYQGDRARFQAVADGEDSERIKGIADQLQMISHRVAANVSAHSQKMGDFSDQIGEPDDADSEHLITAIDEIIQANADMQTQLDHAQQRIAQQSQLIEQASQQARTDALTGLANRRALDEFLSNCLSTATEDELLGLLLMDIDHFKNFNDSFGHTTGDAVLASFARSITKCCGQECYAARFGGEEFAVVLNASSPTALAEKAAAIRRYVSEQIISYEDLQLKITASAGVCMLLPEDEIQAAYERADEGLYQSKKAGRDCGHWLNDGTWTLLPDVDGKPLPSAIGAARLQRSAPTGVAGVDTTDDSQVDHDESTAPTEENPSDQADPANETAKRTAEEEDAVDEDASDERAEILDLNSFLGRLEPYLDQLRRAELPTSAIMVEAIGLAGEDEKDSQESWDAVIALVQLNLRGIDVVCLFRRHTLCIFMPGCSQDAALDRAAQIQSSLAECRDSWTAEDCPERLAISVAAATANEESSQFLDRLEAALDEAQDATETQVVIHDGQGCHFHDV